MDDRTIKLIAKEPLPYAGREFLAGDVFEAKPIDAAILTYKRKAKFAADDADVTPEGITEPEPEPEAPRRRRYRRRDLRAEA